MWVPVHNEEWDGDIPLSTGAPAQSSSSAEFESGEVVFRANVLPWRAGHYEVRFLRMIVFRTDYSLGALRFVIIMTANIMS